MTSEKGRVQTTLLQLTAGASAGAITKTAIAPLDRIKILLQIQGMNPEAPKKYKSIFHTGSTVIKEEGFLKLYKSNGVNVLRVIPLYSLRFMFNDQFKDLVRRPNQTTKLTFNQTLTAGSLAGLTQIAITYPLELIRTRLAISADQAGSVKYKGMFDCAKQTIKTEGIRGLYKGILPTALSGTPYIGCQMTFYDLFQHYLVPEDKSYQTFWKLTSGALAGVCAQTITYPGDTLRRRMQTNGMGGQEVVYKGMIDAIVTITKREGMKAFFKGCTANISAAIPGAAIQFYAYESVKGFLGIK
eukprot:gene10965-3673_t